MRDRAPRVSVIVAAYNHAAYVKASLESVLTQTWQDFEIVVTDDGSCDGTPMAVRMLDDPRIDLVTFPENRGACVAMNACLARARGEYIAVLNSDDLFVSDKLERQLAFLDAHPEIGGVFSWPSFIDERGAVFTDEQHKDYRVFDVGNRSRAGWLRHFFYHGNCLCHPTLMVRRACYAAVGRYDERLAQVPDLDLWIRLCSRYDIHVMSERLTAFRIRDRLQNASAPRLEVRVRDLWERRMLHRHYLALPPDLFRATFAADLHRLGLNDAAQPVALARLALDVGTPHQQAFALDLLFDALGCEPQPAGAPEPVEFVRLTAACDLHALGERERLATTVAELRDERERSAATIAELRGERERSATTVAELLGERERSAAAIAELEEGLHGTRAHSHVQQLEIEKLGQLRLEHLDGLDRLTARLAAREAELTAVYRSHSWRLTQPFRDVRRRIDWLRGPVPRRFVRNVLTAVQGQLSRQGPAAFLSHLPYYLRHYRTYAALLARRPPAADGGLFAAAAPVPRDIRLHPELAGVGEPIDASVSIVIPTLNAGLEFHWLLRKLRAQRGLRELEIVIVDSGSTDGTVELARTAGCTLVEIPPAEFSHSHARNTGADAARGDYLLFMVQDAYPIGDYWAYGMLRYLLDHATDRLAAASCAEYSRSDSDMMYDSMINTHYRFLGCLEYDRIGEYQGDDHMSLRSLGQLSDVSCLIPRALFGRYRYRGDYAEDLDLGIRLIRDGHCVAMLASVKVVHSHNRPAYYYLKRSFVDVIFLVGLFDDFVYPHVDSVRGLLVGIVSTAAHLSAWLIGFDETGSERVLHEDLGDWIRTWRHDFVAPCANPRSQLGDARLDAYIDSLTERYLSDDARPDGDAHYEARRFLDAFLARLEHFNAFASGVYGVQDAVLRRELRDVVCKTFAATVGSALGFMYMDQARTEGSEHDMAETIKNELKAGI